MGRNVLRDGIGEAPRFGRGSVLPLLVAENLLPIGIGMAKLPDASSFLNISSPLLEF